MIGSSTPQRASTDELPPTADAVVIGAGIVGTACAWRLALDGLRVVVIDAGAPGHLATAAGMGHIVLIDDSEAQLALTRFGRDLWNHLGPKLPEEAAFRRPGTLWVAENEAEWALAKSKHEVISSRGLGSRAIDGGELARLEPRLRAGLSGALFVPDDGIVFAPAAAAWLLDQACTAGVGRGGRFVRGTPASAIDATGVRLADGRRIDAPIVVNAAGTAAPSLTPGLPIRPRKGHLILTAPAREAICQREIIELAYLTSAHGHADESIAFNVQPRAEGRLLIGASRQYGVESPDLEPRILEALLARAEHFLPGVRELPIERCWTGFRAATPDAKPLIGPHGSRSGLFIAAGHEGLGITTALATGCLIADGVAGREAGIEAGAFEPGREAHW